MVPRPFLFFAFILSLELQSDRLADIQKNLRDFLEEELDECWGELKLSLLIDHILKDILPHAYNQGVGDARQFMLKKLEDLHGDVYAPETLVKKDSPHA